MNTVTYRRKMIRSGDVIEVEIYPVYALPTARGKKRSKSRAAQQALNDKNRLKNLVRMVNANFTEKDFFVTLTFSDDNIPETPQEARRFLKNYLARLRRKCTSPAQFKWLAVLELDGRYHFHVLLAGVSADDISEQWCHGICSISRLRKIDGAFTALAKYYGKHGKKQNGEHIDGCKTWTGSRNLVKPVVTVSDSAVTARRVREYICAHDETELYKLLKKSIREDYEIRDIERGDLCECEDWQCFEKNYQINDISGYYLYVSYVRRSK